MQLPACASGPRPQKGSQNKRCTAPLPPARRLQCAPLLCMLSDMLARRSADSPGAARLPSKVRLAWTARNTAEFEIADPTILQAAR